MLRNPAPAGHLEAVRHIEPAAHSTARASQSLARANSLDPGPKRSEAASSELSFRSVGGASRWPAGPGVRGEKNELRGFAFSPFALVTFIWGRK